MGGGGVVLPSRDSTRIANPFSIDVARISNIFHTSQGFPVKIV